MMLVCTMAVIAASNAGLGVIHALGGWYDLPQGLTIAFCFPRGLAYNLMAAAQKYTRISQFWDTNISGMVTTVAAETVV